MKQDIKHTILPAWKESKNRRPLLVRGARQVGKTYTILNFGRKHFKDIVEINFELRPELKKIFQTVEPIEIIRNIRLVLNSAIWLCT